MTRANDRGKLGFMTVLNRINVATSRGKHRLILVGNVRKLKEMGAKYDARTGEDDSDLEYGRECCAEQFRLSVVGTCPTTRQVSPSESKGSEE
jgi:hypothetical protein